MSLDIVFLMRHPLYLRLYERPLREMAEAGHRIRLVFRRLEKDVETSLLDALLADHPGIVSEESDGRIGWWWPLSDLGRAIRDYARYHAPAYANAPALRARARRHLPNDLADALDRRGLLRRPWIRATIDALCRALERLAPPDRVSCRKLRRWRPDVVLVTPLIDLSYGQTDMIKAARSLGIPSVLAVASWDNLTNKGLVHIQPDRVVLWNDIQRDEAVRLHGLDPSRIVRTGAQPFDQWFEMQPGSDRAAFCARVGGLDPARPILLYLCSSSFICRDEVSFVREWLTALRASGDPAIRSANILIRPHPSNVIQWRNVDFADPGVAIWPRSGAQTVDADRKQAYFDSLHHATCVVGINTSGFIEAGIVGRPTLTLATPQFADTQEGTLHFHYLVEGGLLTVARSFDEHLQQLSATLAHPEEVRERVEQFVQSFVRPQGLNEPASPRVVEAFLSAADLEPLAWRPLPASRMLRPLARRLLGGVRRRALEANADFAWGQMEIVARATVLRPHDPGQPPAATPGSEEARRLERQLSQIAAGDGPVLLLSWDAADGEEALYWVPFVRWMHQIANLEAERIIVLTRRLDAAWFAGACGQVLYVPDSVPRQREEAWANEMLGMKVARVLTPTAASRLVRQYRNGTLALDRWLAHARYAADAMVSTAGTAQGDTPAASTIIDLSGPQGEACRAAWQRLPSDARARVAAVGDAVAKRGDDAVRPALPSASATAIGGVGPAVVAAASGGRSAVVLTTGGRRAAADIALLTALAGETGAALGLCAPGNLDTALAAAIYERASAGTAGGTGR